MIEFLLFIVGLIFGRLWFGFWLLPLVYGVPRTAYYVARGRLGPRALLVYLVPVVVWWVVFVFLALAAMLLGFRDLLYNLYNSFGFFLGQWLGIFAGLAQALSRRGRVDLAADFAEAMTLYARRPERRA